ncbi:MAG: TRAP transporter small permease, partial [Hyphomicrobiaceae bacterium]
PATELPVEAGGPLAPPASTVERVTSRIAVLGGMLALAVALLATTSVLMRWLFNAPIDGDFEFVKMATAVAVFAYLPYTQARRGNIMVDTFTSWLNPRARNAVDAFWDLIYAAFMGYIAYCLVFGTLDALRSGETTMQRQLLIWPSIALSTLLCTLLSITAIATAWRLMLPQAQGSPR